MVARGQTEDDRSWEPHEAVELNELDGDHLVPLRHSQALAELVRQRIHTY